MKGGPSLDLTFVPAYSYRNEMALLYREYNELLLKVSPAMAESLAMQNFDVELDELEKKFGPPAGRLVLCLDVDEPAACVGIKRFNDEICELKRLYVRPQYRGHRLGEKLTLMMMDEARSAGYSRMYLDTLPGLKTALKIYRSMGFYDIERYYDNPVKDGIHLGFDL